MLMLGYSDAIQLQAIEFEVNCIYFLFQVSSWVTKLYYVQQDTGAGNKAFGWKGLLSEII